MQRCKKKDSSIWHHLGRMSKEPYFVILNKSRFYTIIKLTQEFEMQSNNINYFKYKSFNFYVFILSAIGAVLGAAYFRNIYYVFTLAALTYTVVKYTQMIFVLAYVIYRFEEAYNSYKKRLQANHSSFKEITNVYILPNYNQDEELLKESIANLAKHSRAKNYCLFLAMEKHELNAQEKAKKLILQYSKYFRLMSYTTHELKPYQSKSKASNINWCGINMYPKLLENFVNLDTVMITVMDSDSLIPQAYVDQVERHIEENYEKRHTFVYQPPQIFSRNQREAAFFVRIMDTLMSYAQVSNLYSMFNFTMGVSNYTISYRLLERIGFWDTCIYSKGEDIRIASKALWKSQGEVQTCPIYVPINQLNLTTHQGLWADFKARMLQAKRHSQDQVQCSYTLANFLNSKIPFLRRFHALFTIIEVYAMVITIPIPIIILLLQDIVGILPKADIDPGNTFMIYNNVNTVIMLTGFALYHLLKKRASNSLYGIEPMNFFYSLQTALLQIPAAIVFGFIPMIQASYNLMMDTVTFSVTPKGKAQAKNKNTENPQVESFFQPEQIEEKTLFQSSKDEAITVSN